MDCSVMIVGGVRTINNSFYTLMIYYLCVDVAGRIHETRRERVRVATNTDDNGTNTNI
jgi:hypothetical protein